MGVAPRPADERDGVAELVFERMFDYYQPMVHIVSESGGGNEVFHRWRCDQCNELGRWTFDRDAAERDRRKHVCRQAVGVAVKTD
jgi:hypothetical protein